MNKIVEQLSKLLGVPASDFRPGANGEAHLTVPEGRFRDIMTALSKDFDLISLFCAQGFAGHPGFTLLYAFELSGCPEIAVIERLLPGNEATSIARRFPSASWYEREITDGFGVVFSNAFDQRRLFLHEVYPADFHPLLKSFRNQPVETRKQIAPEDEYRFNRLEGEGVYQIPVGPVHAGIIEPGHFRFSVIGETIFNLEVRLFYKHRGVEKLAEGRTPAECLPIAESISGDETAANATAFCDTVEKICGISVPPRAWQLRTIFLEMERIYSHLGDMAGMITDVAYPVGASNFYILREEVLRQDQSLTGSRFLKGILAVGGLKRDVTTDAVAGLTAYLKNFTPRLNEAIDIVRSSPSVIDRLETTGVIKNRLLRPLHVTGPAARASGGNMDTRTDHPYGIYAQLPLQPHVSEKGDVMSRFEIKAAEIANSVALINRIISEMREGEVMGQSTVKDGHALVLVEAPRGQSMHWVCIKNGIIDRYKIRTASFCNWQSIQHAVLGNIVPDFPLINKSLNLSYAGTDL